MTSAAAWLTSHCRARSTSRSGSSVRTVIVWVKLRCTGSHFLASGDVGLLELGHPGDVEGTDGAGFRGARGLGWDAEHRAPLVDGPVDEGAVVDIEEIRPVRVAHGAAAAERVGDPVLHPRRPDVSIPHVADEEPGVGDVPGLEQA